PTLHATSLPTLSCSYCMRKDEGTSSPVASRARSRDSPSPSEELPSPGGPLPKKAFDPLAQHRDWCPWICEGKENVDPGVSLSLVTTSAVNQQGWKAVLDLLMPIKNNSNAQGGTQAQASGKL
ncbi:hypothetical protein GOODEAATRI_024744, partial [Goodea atripinnis]